MISPGNDKSKMYRSDNLEYSFKTPENSSFELDNYGSLQSIDLTATPKSIDKTVYYHSYNSLFFAFLLYGVAFSMLIPALPGLTLQLAGGNAGKASLLYGAAMFTKYILEFLSAPILGSLADRWGRKPILLLAFIVCVIEFVLLSVFPSVYMLFFTRIMSGIGDGGTATVYAIATDIALYNEDNISVQYGQLGAMIGLAYVFGPYLGGFLCEKSFLLCFASSSCISAVGAISCYFLVPETLNLRQLTAEGESYKLFEQSFFVNPIRGLRMHLSNPKVRYLSLPLFLCTVNHGLSFIWFMYMSYRYHSSPTQVGIYLSFHGLLAATVQGFLIYLLIPRFLSEENAATYGLLMAALQTVSVALCNEVWQLYVVHFTFSLGAIAYPAIKAIVVTESLRRDNAKDYIANLHGAIGSIRTLANATGSLLFSALFAYGLSIKPSPLPSLGFIFGGFLYFIAAVILHRALSTQSFNADYTRIDDDSYDDGNSEIISNSTESKFPWLKGPSFFKLLARGSFSEA